MEKEFADLLAPVIAAQEAGMPFEVKIFVPGDRCNFFRGKLARPVTENTRALVFDLEGKGLDLAVSLNRAEALEIVWAVKSEHPVLRAC